MNNLLKLDTQYSIISLKEKAKAINFPGLIKFI